MFANDSGGVGSWFEAMLSGGDETLVSGVAVGGLDSSGAVISSSCVKSGGKYENRRPWVSVVAGFSKMEFDRNVG